MTYGQSTTPKLVTDRSAARLAYRWLEEHPTARAMVFRLLAFAGDYRDDRRQRHGALLELAREVREHPSFQRLPA